ncbi:hypothetical protein KDA_74520 [Dictyobacter alpinus]|uniref:Uncharacterized protein n=1 Tax=Dictyobacter alpinus TaxID=2014873 RepID=A0A402AZL0_9CHLR|nr:hypothetical protein KDA_00020 [Dictyobacter alpinus]GCE29176.1 hypothetical protein KDA_46600 [Dictyobacter alpinus]GCE29179.1 hypothetical protein KDA_46630 [Dictyobacter alpinus]GCE31968.1 hypothetical protein KDA_74520 [Dictyobacter alpinus]
MYPHAPTLFGSWEERIAFEAVEIAGNGFDCLGKCAVVESGPEGMLLLLERVFFVLCPVSPGQVCAVFRWIILYTEIYFII